MTVATPTPLGILRSVAQPRRVSYLLFFAPGAPGAGFSDVCLLASARCTAAGFSVFVGSAFGGSTPAAGLSCLSDSARCNIWRRETVGAAPDLPEATWSAVRSASCSAGSFAAPTFTWRWTPESGKGEAVGDEAPAGARVGSGLAARTGVPFCPLESPRTFRRRVA